MAVRRILMGQVWRSNVSGEDFLVTRVYDEAFSTFAMLRNVGSETSETRRVKVQKSSDGVALEGYTYTQEEQR